VWRADGGGRFYRPWYMPSPVMGRAPHWEDSLGQAYRGSSDHLCTMTTSIVLQYEERCSKMGLSRSLDSIGGRRALAGNDASDRWRNPRFPCPEMNGHKRRRRDQEVSADFGLYVLRQRDSRGTCDLVDAVYLRRMRSHNSCRQLHNLQPGLDVRRSVDPRLKLDVPAEHPRQFHDIV